MNTIEQIDVFTFKFPHHYQIGGHKETPGRLPGTDYYLEPQWQQVYSRATESCLVKITLSNGDFGWGEAQAPITPETTATLICTLLGPSLLGQQLGDIAGLNHRMYYLMLARGHFGSFLVDAIAGLDTALWDLRGKAHGVPIFELLGGSTRLRLPAYISGLRKKTIEEKVSAASDFDRRGFAGVKIFSGSDAACAEEEARAVRAALPADSFFAVDALWSYDLMSAARIGKLLEELGGAWLEAPLDPEDINAHHALARMSSTPIAVGETLRTARAFEPWLRSRALSVGQPDLMRAGITGTMKIFELFARYSVPITLHVGVATGIGLAATWQIAATEKGRLPQEHQCDLFEVANSILHTPLQERDGHLEVPTLPGIGVDVNEAAVISHSAEHWIVDRNGRRVAGGEQ